MELRGEDRSTQDAALAHRLLRGCIRPGKRGICKRITARGKQPCVYPAPAHRSRVFRSARPTLRGHSSLACDACPAGNNLLIFPGLPGVRVMVVVVMMVMVCLRER